MENGNEELGAMGRQGITSWLIDKSPPLPTAPLSISSFSFPHPRVGENIDDHRHKQGVGLYIVCSHSPDFRYSILFSLPVHPSNPRACSAISCKIIKMSRATFFRPSPPPQLFPPPPSPKVPSGEEEGMMAIFSSRYKMLLVLTFYSVFPIR